MWFIVGLVIGAVFGLLLGVFVGFSLFVRAGTWD